MTTNQPTRPILYVHDADLAEMAIEERNERLRDYADSYAAEGVNVVGISLEDDGIEE